MKDAVIVYTMDQLLSFVGLIALGPNRVFWPTYLHYYNYTHYCPKMKGDRRFSKGLLCNYNWPNLS